MSTRNGGGRALWIGGAGRPRGARRRGSDPGAVGVHGERAGLAVVTAGLAAVLLLGFPARELARAIGCAARAPASPDERRRATRVWTAAARNAWVLSAVSAVAGFVSVFVSDFGGLSRFLRGRRPRGRRRPRSPPRGGLRDPGAAPRDGGAARARAGLPAAGRAARPRRRGPRRPPRLAHLRPRVGRPLRAPAVVAPRARVAGRRGRRPGARPLPPGHRSRPGGRGRPRHGRHRGDPPGADPRPPRLRHGQHRRGGRRPDVRDLVGLRGARRARRGRPAVSRPRCGGRPQGARGGPRGPRSASRWWCCSCSPSRSCSSWCPWRSPPDRTA